MDKLRPLFILLLALSSTRPCAAQGVPQKTVVEHFTNTFCSICASRNPGFFNNLSQFADVLHLAYYTSAPYPACPFSQMNRIEQDARANYYGVFGATPRLVVNGIPVPPNTNYSDPALFQTASGLSSNYSLGIAVARLSDTLAEARIRIQKVAADTLSSLLLYATVSQDTVLFNANNGENVHYNKFHRSLSGPSPQLIVAPVAPGDSTSLVLPFEIGSSWGDSRVTVILQDLAGHGLQAERSEVLPKRMVPSPPDCASALCMYPQPARDKLWFSALPPGFHHYVLYNALGQSVQRGVVYDTDVPISLSAQASGLYIMTMQVGTEVLRGVLIKY